MISDDIKSQKDKTSFITTLISKYISKNEHIINILLNNNTQSPTETTPNLLIFAFYDFISSNQQNTFSKITNLKHLLHYTSTYLSKTNFNKDKLLQCIIYTYKQLYINIYTIPNNSDSKHKLKYINDTITKLYNANKLDINDINLLLNTLLILCTFKIKNNNLHCSSNTNIKNDEFITLTFEFLIELSKDNKNEECVVNVLSFFYNEFIQNNYNNIFHLTTESYYKNIIDIWKITLLLKHNYSQFSIIYNTILQIFLSLYKERFSQWNAMHNIINLTKTFLINFNTQPTHDIINNLYRSNLLYKTIDSIIDKINDLGGYDDLYRPNLTFYFGGNVNNYITWNAGVLPKSDLVIVFSFKLIDNSKQSYGLMSINAKNIKYLNIYLSKETNNDSFKFVIDYKRSKRNHIIQTDYVIKLNKTYLIVVSFNSKEAKIFYKTTGYSNYKCISEKMNPDLKSQKLKFSLGKTEVNLDCNNNKIYPFKGFIGPVIGLFTIDNTFIKNIFALKRNYYYLLYLKTSDFKYTNIGLTIPKEEEDAFMYFKEQKTNILENILVFITDPFAFESVVPYNKYNIQIKNNTTQTKHEVIPNIYDFQKLTYLSGQKSISYSNHFNQTFSVYKTSNILYTFLQCNGLRYISLQFEYCYQILLINSDNNIVLQM